MPRSDPEFDAETLRAELDARWPDATGASRATTDETHRLALLHPEYDGFLTLHVTARADLDGVFVVPSPELANVVTSHHRIGPLERGQELPIDLELHPGHVRELATSGTISLVDASGEQVTPDVRLTLATDDSLDCVLAGAIDGPFEDPAAFESTIVELTSGRGSARRLAHRIEALVAGREDPGWSRLPWRRA
ncbi:MAG: hypothetical protein JWL76_2229 [Thermoleophilia bacterium]|nr:hypothetical protein [Thermoleophilia bacterium]